MIGLHGIDRADGSRCRNGSKIAVASQRELTLSGFAVVTRSKAAQACHVFWIEKGSIDGISS